MKSESISKLPVQERLRRHFRRLSADIVNDADDAIHSGTPEAVANFREDFIREIVGRIYEQSFRMSKGPIFDTFGNRSNSIDCVVCAPNHPLFLDRLGRDTALLVDGVHSAIEIKPDISSMPASYGAELIRGLEQLRSCKRLLRTEAGITSLELGRAHPALRDWLLRVPAHMFSVKAGDLITTAQYIGGYYQEKQVPLSEQFDFLVVLGLGMLEVVKWPRDGVVTPKIVVRHLADDALGNFLFRASTMPGPEMRMSRSVVDRYLAGVFDDHQQGVVSTFGSF